MNQYIVGLKLHISGSVAIQTGWMIRSSSPEGGKEMYLFPKIQAGSYSLGTGVPFRGQSGGGVNSTSHIHLVSK
jgi:hypothetical protein